MPWRHVDPSYANNKMFAIWYTSSSTCTRPCGDSITRPVHDLPEILYHLFYIFCSKYDLWYYLY